ncbi:MAG: TolC family protein [Candidatus Eisenbacteria bacterium]|nr:TolC family protein [Candidatus Eisenbacteria bacterium]
MRTTLRAAAVLAAASMTMTAGSPSRAETLSADRAVQIALRHSPDVVNAGASVLDAKGGVYGAYSGVLPHVSASVARDNNVASGILSPIVINGIPTGGTFVQDRESHGTTPGISGSWSVLNLSSIEGLSSAKSSLRAAKQRLASSRNDIAFNTRRQFYEAVKSVHLAGVANFALHLARDNERRVRALFEVGSVSRSDVLKAQVNTAQSELDSVSAEQAVLVQRVALASVIGLEEGKLGEIDTVLSVQDHDYDEAALLAEAGRNRADLQAAEISVRAAQASKMAARLARVPYLTVSGGYEINVNSRSASTVEPPGNPPFANPGVEGFNSSTDRQSSVRLALNWDFIDGLSSDARNASASAQLERAIAARDALKRNLASDVHQALVAYHDGLAQGEVAKRGLDSASENLKLTQQKYNVGSATILDLVDAQVQLERAANNRVTAAAAIRVAEAQVDRVRGKQE